MKILHIVRQPNDARALAVARGQSGAHEVTVLLLHDAVLTSPPEGMRAVACRADLEARGVGSRVPAVDYDGIVDLIDESDKVFSW